MKRLRHICLPLVCVGMLLGLVANAAPDVCADVKDSPGVLLINKPDLYASPSSNGQKSATPWPAGSSVQTLDCTSDAATSGASVRWYRVKVQATEGWLPEVFLGLAPIAVEADKNLPIGREPLSRYRPLPPGYKPDDLVPVGPPTRRIASIYCAKRRPRICATWCRPRGKPRSDLLSFRHGGRGPINRRSTNAR